MTRINCVPVETLSDKHLLAEYKEITRPFNKVIARIEKGTMHSVKIPEKYCLGTGHETFFFNKLLWLMTRYCQLFEELLYRGFNIDEEKFGDIRYNIEQQLVGTPYWCNWEPTPEDMYLNMARLVKRCSYVAALDEYENRLA